MVSVSTGRLALMLAGSIILTACEEGSEFKLFDKPLFNKKENADGEAAAVTPAAATTLIERDVEAPDVFQKTDNGLWDGRPSLGGVWVAHADVVDPERVIIRNKSNGKFVIGALFRRERDNPGPRFQVSSDAAEALGMLAGAPAELNVTALRREEVPVVPEATEPALDAAEPIETSTIETAKLDPVASAAASAIKAAEIEAASAGTAAAAAVAPKPTSSLAKPYIQIGIFSVEENANNTADTLRKEGLVPTVKKSSSSGKTFWRVIVGPAGTKADRTAMTKKVQKLGFADAYAVSN